MPLRRVVFGATILSGAFLLFHIQPLLGRWILPWFGGGTAVWTTSMLFFQTLLFAGYAYAFASERLPRIAGTLLHLGLIGVSLLFLPVAPPETWKPDGAGDPTWAILKLLSATAGIPGLLLASTGPLVQAWAARSEPGRSPYRLYALSNAGSLTALLTYPVLVEPHLGLHRQSTGWTWGFAGFAALSALGILGIPRSPALPVPSDRSPGPGAGLRARWIALPAIASALLLATTNQLSQEIAVLPFLWVLPLTVYLISFIVVFDRPAWAPPRIVAPATAVLAFLSVAAYHARPVAPASLAVSVGLHLAALLGVCLLCHGELARLRPPPDRLTGYYLAISGGGALGSLVVSLLAPLVFSTYAEWKLGIALAFIGSLIATAWIYRATFQARRNVAAVVLVTAGLGLAFLAAMLSTYVRRLESSRTFYGAVTVDVTTPQEQDDAEARDMNNGRVLHGRQYPDEKRRRWPTTYYGETSGVGRAIGRYRSRPELRLGVVGLGVGTLAAYVARPGQSVRFYEINPDVPRLARRWFTYLEDCAGTTELVLGDARLSLEREAPQGFHVLALDAFSGHTVPTHLLTVEAMRIYLRHVREDGIVAIHVSNQFLRLAPVARGMARRLGLQTLLVDSAADGKTLSCASSWMLCAREAEVLRDLPGVEPDGAGAEEIVWTDDASDLFSILKAGSTP
ncbi:MAG TPA: fused MFS/spermidine synthase [Planctomycetota bacterium]|nr:fused MFS/spermidine synthase [Planctomycetota bacterium]